MSHLDRMLIAHMLAVATITTISHVINNNNNNNYNNNNNNNNNTRSIIKRCKLWFLSPHQGRFDIFNDDGQRVQ